MQVQVRKARERDIPQLWQLMKELAVFEGYIEDFAITTQIILEKGFRKAPPDFHCLVAEDLQSSKLVGMVVYYFLPYTARNRPTMFLKELYVAPEYRGKKIGNALMQRVAKEAVLHNCYTIRWLVAPWNGAAVRFYERMGASEDRSWLNFEWTEEQFSLAASKAPA